MIEVRDRASSSNLLEIYDNELYRYLFWGKIFNRYNNGKSIYSDALPTYKCNGWSNERLYQNKVLDLVTKYSLTDSLLYSHIFFFSLT